MDKRLATIGIASTIGYLLFVIWLFWGRGAKILAMEPNNIGDFLAGLFGPLAVLWLILGFFQQGVELRQNTRALELQAQELKNSVEQQRALAIATREQLEAERAASEFECQRHVYAAQPRFILSTANSNTSSEGVRYTLTIYNSGVGASAVKIGFDPPLRSHGQLEFDHFPGGNTHQFVALFEREHPADGDRATVAYRDALNEPRTATYLIYVIDGMPRFQMQA